MPPAIAGRRQDMTTVTTPTPPKKTQSHRARGAAVSRRQDDALRRLRPQRDLRAHHRSVLRDGRRPDAGDQALGHRLLEQEPGVFPRRLARLQHRPRADAVGRRPGRCSRTASSCAIGVSGDGDTGAIGIGQFVHLMRRNLPIIYIIEDNGCYGLTKGQFSPTADLGSKLKNGVANDLPPIDTCALAIELGASFVARSFSGDKKQLLSILKAALGHRGTAHDRRALAVRDLQRPRGLDQELRLRQGSRRGARRGQLRAVLRGHQRRVRRRGRRRPSSCTTARSCT